MGLSPTIIAVDSGLTKAFESESENSEKAGKQLAERALDALDDVPSTENKRKKFLQSLEGERSIEGHVEDINIADGPKIRKYLERYERYAKGNEWRVYSQQEIKDYSSLKSILSHRSQFNDTKREFHNQLQKYFNTHEPNTLQGQGKDGHLPLEKAKKRVVVAGGVAEKTEKGSAKEQGFSLNFVACFNRYYIKNMIEIKDDVTFKAHGKTYKFSKNALGFLDNRSKFRVIIVWIITWNCFEKIILLLIICNSLGLGMKDYLDPLN